MESILSILLLIALLGAVASIFMKFEDGLPILAVSFFAVMTILQLRKESLPNIKGLLSNPPRLIFASISIAFLVIVTYYFYRQYCKYAAKKAQRKIDAYLKYLKENKTIESI